jgi:hypothetical protein
VVRKAVSIISSPFHLRKPVFCLEYHTTQKKNSRNLVIAFINRKEIDASDIKSPGHHHAHSMLSTVQRKQHAQIIGETMDRTAPTLAQNQRLHPYRKTIKTLAGLTSILESEWPNPGRLSCFVSCLRTLLVSRQTASDGRGGSGRDLFEALSRYVPHRSEEHNRKTSSQDVRCPGRDVKP